MQNLVLHTSWSFQSPNRICFFSTTKTWRIFVICSCSKKKEKNGKNKLKFVFKKTYFVAGPLGEAEVLLLLDQDGLDFAHDVLKGCWNKYKIKKPIINITSDHIKRLWLYNFLVSWVIKSHLLYSKWVRLSKENNFIATANKKTNIRWNF